MALTGGLNLELGDDRGVVGRPFQRAWGLVDMAGATSACQRGTRKDVVDAQPEVAAESAHAVIPPAEACRRLVEFSEHVHETVGHERAERLAFLVAEEHVPFP